MLKMGWICTVESRRKGVFEAVGSPSSTYRPLDGLYGMKRTHRMLLVIFN
jgi:hypothetical protein